MLVFISGFGGAGKDTIANKILKRNSDFEKLVTYTTREPRKGEVDGVDYNFISEEEFVHKSYQDDWLECRKYNFVGKSDIVRYATPKYQDYINVLNSVTPQELQQTAQRYFSSPYISKIQE